MKTIAILYVPVIHEGYIKFFSRNKNLDAVYILDEEPIEEFTSLSKEIRQIQSWTACNLVSALLPNATCVFLLDYALIQELQQDKDLKIITANESVSSSMVHKYFPDHRIIIDNIFLKWDEKSVYSQEDVATDDISTKESDRAIMKTLEIEAQKSSDWWRRNGSAVVGNKKEILLIDHNRHLPSEHTPYAMGDPRDFVKAGKDSHIASALHAEQANLAKAAKEGIALKSLNWYTLIFPCPVCAKLIAESGIKKIYFKTGHASLEGAEMLKAKGIKIIRVQ